MHPSFQPYITAPQLPTSEGMTDQIFLGAATVTFLTASFICSAFVITPSVTETLCAAANMLYAHDARVLNVAGRGMYEPSEVLMHTLLMRVKHCEQHSC